MSAPLRGIINNAISARVAYPAATDAEVPGREGSTPEQIATYDQASLGFRVLVSSNGHRYTKTSLTKYADGGRITQEDAGGGAEGIDGTYGCAPSVAVGNVVFLAGTNFVSLANASVIASTPALGIVTSKPSTSTCVVRSYGPVTLAGLTPGATYYLAATDGLVTATAPSGVGAVVQPLGVATSATTLFLQITRRTNRGPDGSSTAPTYGFATSLGAGLYLAGSETVGIAAGGLGIAQVSTQGIGVLVTGSGTADVLNALKLNRETSGTPADGIGVAIEFDPEAAVGRLTAGRIVGAFSTVGAGNETGVIDALPAFAGTVASAGLRVDGHNGANGALTCGLSVRPVAAAFSLSLGVTLEPYSPDLSVPNASLTLGGIGSGSVRVSSPIQLTSGAPKISCVPTNAGLDIVPNGFGNLNLRNAADDTTVFGVQSVASGNAGLAAHSLITTSGIDPETQNTPVGRVRILSGASQVTVNNDLVTTDSHIWWSIRTVTNNPVIVSCITAVDGAFTIHLNGDPGVSNCDVDFLVINPAA